MTAQQDRYGFIFIMELKNCDKTLFKRRKIKKILKELAKQLGWKTNRTEFWDYRWHQLLKRKAPPEEKGVAVCLFLRVNTMMLHAVERNSSVYFELFSCHSYSKERVRLYIEKQFGGELLNFRLIERR